ncbi:unnamed protein product, partial [Phaeothamnion confervicola]
QVLLIRVGEFYETFGADAVMLVQHAGLNPMGGRARAGCPIANVQQTLDGLTAAGLTVAVFEEVADVDGGRRGPPAVRQRKKRVLTQARGEGVVSPANPAYLYDLCLRSEDVAFRPSRPFWGLRRSAMGHTLVKVSADERTVRVSERLTDQAVRAALAAGAAAEPVFVQNLSPAELRGLDGDLFAEEVVRRAGRELGLSDAELQRFRWLAPEEAAAAATGASAAAAAAAAAASASAAAAGPGMAAAASVKAAATAAAAAAPSGAAWWARPRPVYTSTAVQIGLLENLNVPPLARALLPPGSPAAAERFLWRWLLTPPPHAVADRMRELLAALPRLRVGLPAARAVPVGKAVAMLSAGQANVPLLREIDECVRAMLVVLGGGGDANGDNSRASPYTELVGPLLALVSFQSGIEARAGRLAVDAAAVAREVAAVVARRDCSDLPSADPHGFIPPEYFSRNEAAFRGCVAATHPTVAAARAALDDAAAALSAAVARDFGELAARDLVHDQMQNVVALRQRPPEGEGANRGRFVHARGRDQRELTKRYTTPEVDAAAAAYVDAVAAATDATRRALQELSARLLDHLPTIVQASHWAATLQAAELHARHSRAHGWCLPQLRDADDPNITLEVQDLLPYWLADGAGVGTDGGGSSSGSGLGGDNGNVSGSDSSGDGCGNGGGSSGGGGDGEGVANSFVLDGIFLLTAPNMSGKSTLMRATAAAALLATAGLHAPAARMTSPRYDAFFLRTASYDVPAERMSAFALEMDDVRVMLRDCTRRSLAMVDEI